MLREILALIPRGRGRIAGLLLLGAAGALAEGGGLMALGAIVTTLEGRGGPAGFQLEGAMLLYLAVVAAAAAAGWGRSMLAARLRLETADRLRRDGLSALLEAEWPVTRRIPGPTASHILTVEAARVGSGVDYLFTSAAIAMRLPVLFAIAFRLSPALATATLAAGGSLAFVTSRADRRARHSGEQMLTTGRAVHARTLEALSGRRVIKAFGLERVRVEAYAGALEGSRAAQLAQQRAFAGNSAVIAFAVPAISAAILWMAVRMLGLDLGTALIFALTYGRLGQSVLALRAARRIVEAAIPAEAAVRDLIAHARRAAEPSGTDAIAVPSHHIALRSVTVQYEDGRTALSNVTVAIPVGAVVSITGPSGAGKSTLADVAMGLAVPTDGVVSLDDRALDAAGRRAWRRHVGYVPQDAFLFDETIRDNLLAGRPHATEDALWHALEEAGAAAAVRGLPAGLDTVAGERGARLSGGEAQRIALARALLREPALLVLDEPTSALDAGAEARIIDTIERLRGRHTILVVAHRERLAAIADLTIALDGGRVVQIAGATQDGSSARSRVHFDGSSARSVS